MFKKIEIENRKATILLVDDDQLVNTVTCNQLTKFRYSVYSFLSANQALRFYKNHYKKIDLVILDYSMPEMNGKELLRHLQEISSHVLVLFLTGSQLIDDENGLEHFETVVKPANLTELENKISTLLNQDFKKENFKPDEIEMNDIKNLKELLPEFDIDEALDNLGFDVDLYEELLDDFTHDYNNTGNELRESLEANNIEDAIAITHSMKSIAGTIGDKKLFDISQQIVNQLRSNQMANIGQLAKSFSHQLEKSCGLIKDYKSRH